MKGLLPGLVLLYIVTLFLCTGGIAGTETTNGDEVTVTADAHSIKGTAPAGFVVQIFSDDYFPFNDSGFTSNMIVGDNGIFEFSNLEFGNYNIFCKSPSGDSSIFIQKIKVQVANDSDTDTVAITIAGVIGGTLIDTLNNSVKGACAFIKGSPFFAITNDSGKYDIKNIPEGSYVLIFTIRDRNYPDNSKGPPVSVTVDVMAGVATEIDTVVFKK